MQVDQMIPFALALTTRLMKRYASTASTTRELRTPNTSRRRFGWLCCRAASSARIGSVIAGAVRGLRPVITPISAQTHQEKRNKSARQYSLQRFVRSRDTSPPQQPVLFATRIGVRRCPRKSSRRQGRSVSHAPCDEAEPEASDGATRSDRTFSFCIPV